MKHRSWSAAEDEVMRRFYPHLAAKDLAGMMRRTVAAVHAHAKQLGLSKAPGFVSEAARRTTLARSPFTPEIVATIERLYPTTLTEDIAAMVGISTARVLAYANKRGWKKTSEFVRETARARTTPDHPMRQTQFQKGLVPWNKGRKGVVGVQEACRATQFKPGQKPHTWVPVGSYRICEGALQRKVNDDPGPTSVRWKPVHRLLWEEANGPVPDGHLVRFKPGMATTVLEQITLERIECVSRVENMRRNTVHNYPPELARLAQLRGAMNRQINARERAMQEKQP